MQTLNSIIVHCGRNRAKKDSLTTVNLVFLLLKTVFDCVSRLLIYSTFMFVVNEGQFSTLMTVKAYYATFAVLVIFNMIINTNEQYCSAETWRHGPLVLSLGLKGLGLWGLGPGLDNFA